MVPVVNAEDGKWLIGESLLPVVVALFGNLLAIEVYLNGFTVMAEKVQLFVKSATLLLQLI